MCELKNICYFLSHLAFKIALYHILYDSIYIKSKEIIYNERKQISGYLRTGIGQEDGMTGKRGKKGHKGAQGNFCSDRQVHYLGYKYIYIWDTYFDICIKLYTLDMCNLCQPYFTKAIILKNTTIPCLWNDASPGLIRWCSSSLAISFSSSLKCWVYMSFCSELNSLNVTDISQTRWIKSI